MEQTENNVKTKTTLLLKSAVGEKLRSIRLQIPKREVGWAPEEEGGGFLVWRGGEDEEKSLGFRVFGEGIYTRPVTRYSPTLRLNRHV